MSFVTSVLTLSLPGWDKNGQVTQPESSAVLQGNKEKGFLTQLGTRNI